MQTSRAKGVPSLCCLCTPCRNDNQVNNRLVLLLSSEHGEQEVYWKDVVAGDLIKVCPHAAAARMACEWCMMSHMHQSAWSGSKAR